MNNKGISPEIKDFIDKFISSLGELEVFLFLKTHSQREWTAMDIATEFRSNLEMAHQQLERLYSKDLIQRSDQSPYRYNYRLRGDGIDRVVEELQKSYQERRFTITNYIYDRPMDKILGFANAFKFKKDE